MNLDTPRLSFKTWLSSTLLAGLVVLVPLGLTVYVLNAIVGTADHLIDVLPGFMVPQEHWRFPGSGILLGLLITLTAGLFARNLVGRIIGQALVSVIGRVPVVAGLYKLFRQISETFLGGSGKGFKSVVLVEWPRKETWTLAFVTGDVRGELAPDADAWQSLFIPATPNPTSGFYFMARKSELKPTKLSVEAAFKVIISAGALSPESTA